MQLLFGHRRTLLLFAATCAAIIASVLAFSFFRLGVVERWMLTALDVLLLAGIFHQLKLLLTWGEANATVMDSLRQQLQLARADQEKISTDLGLLGNYGNLLLGSTDLAEALQVSQQMLSQLLPDCAGSIYPLTDGEGLAEVTYLWGTHVGDTRTQASEYDCRSISSQRIHFSSSQRPEEICPHIVLPPDAAPVSAACIPLYAQGESLGWLYLTAPGLTGVPKLPVAIAAAEQLSQALANLKLRESLRDLSVRDPLTGLFNRRYLSESLGREMARGKRRNLPLAVMMFDLDHFKAFNDNYGHAAGDALLVAFGRLLGTSFRDEDIACRLGGEEFILIMPEMESGIAERRALELLDATAALTVMHEGQILPPITTSIGLAMMPEHGQKPAELMAAADQALYRAKATGRKRYCIAGVG